MANARRFGAGVSACGLILAVSCSQGTPTPPIAKSSAAVAASAPPNIDTFVVYAANKVTLGTGDHSLGGDIGVATGAGTSPQLIVGAQDGLDVLHILYAPSVSLGNLAIVGAVDTNALTNSGGHLGVEGAYPTMPSLPTFFSATPGTTNVTVAAGPPQTLTPGNYGALTDNGVLFLKPGTYSFTSITLGNNAQLQALRGGSTSVRVAGTITTGASAQIFASGQPATDLTIVVDGTDGSSPAVSVGANSQLVALLASPNGTVSLGNGVQATGAFIGMNFVAGNNVNLTFQNGVPNQTPSLATFVAYAERSVTLGTADLSVGGDIGVAATAQAGFGTQLTVGANDQLDPAHTISAPTVALGQSALAGDVVANSLQNNGGFFASQLPYVAADMPAMPFLAQPAPGSHNITVPAGGQATLNPGPYGTLTDDGIVFLSPGSYSFASVVLGNNAQLFAQPGGVTTVAIAQTLAVGQGALVSAPLTASNLVIVVAGADGTSGGLPAASIGVNSTVVGLVAVPNGTLSLGAFDHVVGAVVAFDIAAGNNVTLTFQGGFTLSASAHGTQQLMGYYGLNPDPTVAPLVGPVPPSTTVELDIGLPVPDLSKLQTFVQNVSDPTNSLYRQYATSVADFATRFGPLQSDYQNVMTWATNAGFTIVNQFGNYMLLSVNASASQIEQALFVNLVYRRRFDGSSFVTVDRDPSVNLTTRLLEINGLDDFVLPAPAANQTGCQNSYAPADLRAAYLGPNCQSLLGDNETVGILSLQQVPAGPGTDIANFDALQNPPDNANNVTVAYVAGGIAGFASPSLEGPGDVEAVQSIAPNANVVLFEGKTGAFSHADSVLHQMATWQQTCTCNTTNCCSPFLSTATNSFGFAKSNNAQQALYEMAAQGTSFFVASGDYGDIGDPGDCTDFDAQTIVGGTKLSTFPLVGGAYPTTPTPPAIQCGPSSCYYQSETTWNDGTFGNDISAGGIMDGVIDPFQDNNLPSGSFGSCHCFPYPACCPSGVLVPQYQQKLHQVSSDASGMWRSYPDVSMQAETIEVFGKGSCQGFAGTSAASPMWAGVVALADELSDLNHAGHVGFANPAIYDIGYMRGQSLDLYKTSFNDIADGSTNAPGGNKNSGYAAVPGYDLTTGWGSPTCSLVFQLGTSKPLTSNEPLTHLDLVIVTGGDDLRDDSTGTIAVNFQNGQSINYLLKSGGAGAVHGPDWNNGYFYENDIDLSLCTSSSTTCQGGPIVPPPTMTGNNVSSVTLNLLENNGNASDNEDNWDVSGLSLRLFAPGSLQEICQLDRPGSQLLQDGNYGVNRFSAYAGSTGSGPSGNGPTFTIQGGTGCSSTGFASPSGDDIQGNMTWYGLNEAAVPASSAGIQFIFATGKDDLRSDSGASVDIYDTPNGPAIQHIDIKDQNYYGGFPNDSSQNVVYPFTGSFDSNGLPLIDHIVVNVDRNSDPCGCGGSAICICTLDSDQWKLSGLTINTWQPGGPSTCWMTTGETSGPTDDTTLLTMNPSQTLVSTGCLSK
jgi:kumamolisin